MEEPGNLIQVVPCLLETKHETWNRNCGALAHSGLRSSYCLGNGRRPRSHAGRGFWWTIWWVKKPKMATAPMWSKLHPWYTYLHRVNLSHLLLVPVSLKRSLINPYRQISKRECTFLIDYQNHLLFSSIIKIDLVYIERKRSACKFWNKGSCCETSDAHSLQPKIKLSEMLYPSARSVDLPRPIYLSCCMKLPYSICSRIASEL